MQKPVTAVENSENKKTGMVSATYVSQATCPTSCSFFNNGCYAEGGRVGITTHKLNKSEIIDPNTIADMEAAAIKTLTGARPLRVHVVGDCTTPYAASVVGKAMVEYPNAAWTYTHAWQDVKASDWQEANVLASCESIEEVDTAKKRGYATALVVDKFESTKLYKKDGVSILPCREQTNGIQCVNCKLCFNVEKLKKHNITIGFEAHGINKKKVIESIK